MSKRDVVIFFAGVQSFHAFSHIILSYFVQLPMTFGHIHLTSTLNNWAIAFNAITAVALLWWATKLPKK